MNYHSRSAQLLRRVTDRMPRVWTPDQTTHPANLLGTHIRGDAMQYTAIVNTPGNLPDSESNVATFDTLDEARSWLADEIERDWDAAYEQAGTLPTRDERHRAKLAIDEHFLDAHTEVNHLAPGDSIVIPVGDSNARAYEIQTT